MDKQNIMKINIAICCLLFGFAACTTQNKPVTTKLEKPSIPAVVLTSVKSDNEIEKAAFNFLLTDSNFFAAHLGVSVYDPSEKKYLYNYQSDKYFIPASNTKLFTCYAAMKYLGDSLVGLRYEFNKEGSLSIQATGDPSFLHSDFLNQPVYDFLKSTSQNINVMPPKWNEKPLGYGWAWDDYNDDYMTERSELPIYGNLAKFYLNNDTIAVSPHLFYYNYFKFLNTQIASKLLGLKFSISRVFENNDFKATIKSKSSPDFKTEYVPFKTNYATFKSSDILEKNYGFNTTGYDLLKDTLKKTFYYTTSGFPFRLLPNVIYSQPTDSLLKIMMYRSDNFFAEQTLLMISNEKLGTMNDAAIIDTLLHTDYKDLPQKPKWVDGSGLSRYNLFSPQDFVKLLEKMKNDFAWNRITTILPTGNAGTLSGYYKNYAGKIYAKTGTVSNNLALSGYIITNKNKQLIFSVMVNNHQTSASAIRRAIEKFITDVIDKN